MTSSTGTSTSSSPRTDCTALCAAGLKGFAFRADHLTRSARKRLILDVFSTTKNKGNGIVGLEIEAGSVAATEVSVNGSIEITGYGVAPLDPGVFREGEVVDAEALAKA